VDTVLLRAAVDTLERAYPNVFSLLVLRSGYIVAEHYFRGADDSTHYQLRSATKSFVSALVGIALAKKALRSIDQTLPEFFPGYFAMSGVDDRKRAISIRYLLSMKSGFRWDEMRDGASWSPSRDAAEFILDLPLAERPGIRFNYNSGNSHLLSVIIGQVTRASTLDFANANLFGPLGMPVTAFHWQADRQGRQGGGSGLELTTREMAKFGWLYLNAGCWEGKQVVPADWVRTSTRKWAQPPDDKEPGYGYGYQWWLRSPLGHPMFYAAGFGGQYIFVLPDLDAVVVMTASTGRDAAFSHSRVLRQLIIPALEGGRARGDVAPSRNE
jgi:CubicO group peptidase (beta-lactamase class C family)